MVKSNVSLLTWEDIICMILMFISSGHYFHVQKLLALRRWWFFKMSIVCCIFYFFRYQWVSFLVVSFISFFQFFIIFFCFDVWYFSKAINQAPINCCTWYWFFNLFCKLISSPPGYWSCTKTVAFGCSSFEHPSIRIVCSSLTFSWCRCCRNLLYPWWLCHECCSANLLGCTSSSCCTWCVGGWGNHP